MGNLAGQQLGNYRLVKLLGKGGFAEVYLGQHVRLVSKQAAIKVLHLLDVDARRFQEEAETTEKLVHPHIVRLLDFDMEDGTLFLVLDYAPGGSLRARHPKGSVIPLASVAAYLQELAPALQYAHDQYILHRDIKPDNMLIGRQGELLLSDFGIAVLMQTGHTPSSFAYGIGGTPFYMAPEAYRGKPERASDQYALAVVVYEWLCGSVPFSEGDFIQLGFQHAHEPVPPLHEKNPAISPEVEAVILKALAKEPKERFASVQTFLHAFEQAYMEVRQAEQERLRQAEAQERARRAEEERLRQAELARKQVEEWYQAEEERARQEREERARQAKEQWEKAREERARLAKEQWEKEQEELEHLTAAERSRNQADREPLPPLSVLLQMASASPENLQRRKNLSWYKTAIGVVLCLLIGASTGFLSYTLTTNHTPTATSNAYTATPNAYEQFVAAHGMMFGFDAAHTHFNPFEQELNPSNVSTLRQAWTYPVGGNSSPAVANGIIYTGSNDGSLYALDARSGRKLWNFSTGNFVGSSPAVADGIVYASSNDGSLYALDAHLVKQMWSFPTLGSIYSSPTVANGVVYIGSNDGSLYALDAHLGHKLWSFPTGESIYSSPTVANGVVYIGSFDTSLYALDARSGRKLWSFPTGDNVYSSPAVANGIVYIGSFDKSLYALDARSGRKLWSFPTGGFIGSSPAVANGVVYIGSNDKSLYALDARSGRKLWSFPTDGFIYSSPVVANSIVYASSENGRLYAFHPT